MKNLTIMEMNLTSKEIKLIAFEAKGVNSFNPNMISEFSYRVQGFIYKTGLDFSYVVRRCQYLINSKK